MRREETNQMFKRDGSPSRLCVFSWRERRGYSRAGDCSNNTPPPPNTQHPLPLFLCEEIYFFPCHAILDSHCCGRINRERAVLSKRAYFFSCSVVPVPNSDHKIRSGDRLRSTWLEGRVVWEAVQSSGLPQSNREGDHPYVKSL